MSSLGLRPRDDMSTSGQHIWMFHLQPCIICIMLFHGITSYIIWIPSFDVGRSWKGQTKNKKKVKEALLV